MNQRMWGIKTMTNREWLMEQMQNMSDEELENYVRIDFIWSVDCDDCTDKHKSCLACKINWLQAERKPKLSEAERVILENIPDVFKWIARDNKGCELMIYVDKPYKAENMWERPDVGNRVFKELTAFNHLFQFIKWEDENPYNIEELLKGE